MNRKITLFIVTALLTSLVWVSSVLAAPEAPTVSMEVCVGVQGGRAIGNDESITYSLDKTSGGGGATYAGADTAAIQAAPTSKACFDVVAEPGETYNLTVSAADTLSTTLNGVQINSGASNDLTGSITMLEGDLDGNNAINALDFGLFDATWAQSGADLDGDLDENDAVNALDFGLFDINWLSTGTRDIRNASGPQNVKGTATIKVEALANYANTSPVSMFYKIVVNNPNGEKINNGSIRLEFDPALQAVVAPSIIHGAGCVADLGAPCSLTANNVVIADISPGVITATVPIATDAQGFDDSAIQTLFLVKFVPAGSVACGNFPTCLEKADLIGAGIIDNTSTDSRTSYVADLPARANTIQEYANCEPGLVCAEPTAIALSSNLATPNQSVATIVLVFVASTLVIGSRFAVLNKRK